MAWAETWGPEQFWGPSLVGGPSARAQGLPRLGADAWAGAKASRGGGLGVGVREASGRGGREWGRSGSVPLRSGGWRWFPEEAAGGVQWMNKVEVTR